MEAPAADDASAAAEIEAAPAREGGVAAADQAPAEPTAEPTAEGTAQAAPSSGAAEEKPKMCYKLWVTKATATWR